MPDAEHVALIVRPQHGKRRACAGEGFGLNHVADAIGVPNGHAIPVISPASETDRSALISMKSNIGLPRLVGVGRELRRCAATEPKGFKDAHGER